MPAERILRPFKLFTLGITIALAAAASLLMEQHSFARLQSTLAPVINVGACSFDSLSGKLTLKGQNFQKGATVELHSATGQIAHGKVKVKNSGKIFIHSVAEADLAGGIDVTITNPDGGSVTIHLQVAASSDSRLTEDDVKQIISQAVAQAEASGFKATIAVVDKEGNILGIFRMTGARNDITIGVRTRCAAGNSASNPTCGLEGLRLASLPLSDGATLAAVSKAVTGAFLSSQGHSFTSRTASFIVQEHFPPGIDFQSSGPLFGVQFSQFLVCSDINPRSPLGLAADPGGVALYKNGIQVGGVGVEGDGIYSLDPDPADKDQPVEELVAVAATRGFETPAEIQGDKIIVNGIRFPFVNTPMPGAVSTARFDQLRGDIQIIAGGIAPGIRAAQPSGFRVVSIDSSIPAGRVAVDSGGDRFPFKAGSGLTRGEVEKIIIQAARQAFITRAAIRQPQNSAAEVNISVVDVDGTVLGIFSTIDAPVFGFDVCVQKARTAAFLSGKSAASELRSVGLGKYVNAASADGVKLDGSVAFTDRGCGFLSRPFFPDGIDESENGPFSVAREDFSPFNDGVQLDLVLPALIKFLTTGMTSPGDCTGIPSLANGAQIFPGSVPLYKNGKLVGAIGISGDGVDQDDLIAAMGSAGFEAPSEIRCDRLFVRGLRLPYVKFPRHPNR